MITSQASPPIASLHISSLALIARDVVPVIGVGLWGWQVLEVSLLHWAETMVVGLGSHLHERH